MNDARDIFLRELVIHAMIMQPDILQNTQPQKDYPRIQQKDKKIKNYPRVQPRRKYASDKKLCTLRCNKK